MTKPADRHSPGIGGPAKVGGGDPWVIAPLSAAAPSSPLDRLLAEHGQQRQAAAILTAIAAGRERDRKDRRRIYERLRSFLAKDVRRHRRGEEAALFPLLRARCQPEDGIEKLLARLSAEHAVGEALIVEICRALDEAIETDAPNQASQQRFEAFAEHLRQHIALENAALLPIASARLDGASLKKLQAGLGDDGRAASDC